MTISGSWIGVNGGGSCVTGSDRSCQIVKSNLKLSQASVTFNADDITDAGGALLYNAPANHDGDGDSIIESGSRAISIVLNQPSG